MILFFCSSLLVLDYACVSYDLFPLYLQKGTTFTYILTGLPITVATFISSICKQIDVQETPKKYPMAKPN